MTGATVDISVIVCTYNRSESLARTLESLREQAVPSGLSWEVVVVDNNSTDATRAVVHRSCEMPELTVRYAHEGRQGVAHARNRGLSEAQGRFVIFADDDVIPSHGWLESMHERMQTGEWDAICGRILLKCDSTMPRWLKPELWGFLACLDYGNKEMRLVDEQHPFFTANVALCKASVLRMGGFDTNLGRKGKSLEGGEDTDLFQRMLEAGMRILYLPNAVVHHVVDLGRLRKGYFRRLHYLSGRTSAIRRNDLSGRNVLGVPLFLFPQLGRAAWTYVREGLRLGFENVFRKEMNIWFHLGFMRGRMTAQSRRMQ